MEEESKEEGDGKKKEGRSILQGSPLTERTYV